MVIALGFDASCKGRGVRMWVHDALSFQISLSLSMAWKYTLSLVGHHWDINKFLYKLPLVTVWSVVSHWTW